MSRKNRFGNFMDKKYFYWIIGLVAIYFLFIKKKSQFGRSFPDFSKMSEEDKDKYRKSSFGKSEAQRQRNKDYKAQREAEIKQEKMNKEILNAKEQELSKIKPQIENVLKSIGLKYSPSLQYVIDHNLINLGYGV